MMARSTREDTKQYIEAAARRDPLALGPILGRLAVSVNVSPPVLATVIGAHEQTVMRWVRGEANVRTEWLIPVGRLISFLSWMRVVEWEPLHGSVEERKKQLLAASKVFAEMAGVKPKRSTKD